MICNLLLEMPGNVRRYCILAFVFLLAAILLFIMVLFMGGLTERWTPWKPHGEQLRLWQSKARFRVVCAGRRSGKTEGAKRFMTLAAMMARSGVTNPRYVASAPTHDQARAIYWDDLKLLVPGWAMARRPREEPPTIFLTSGSILQVLGLDIAKRIEGPPLDGIILDEYADMKRETWYQSVRPALSTIGRPGWAWFVGKPRGRNHFFELAEAAKADNSGTWSYHHWKSSDVLDPAEITEATRNLDEASYGQEYEANFINFQGRVYYAFDALRNCETDLKYNPDAELCFCLDFNVSPGVAAVCQEIEYTGTRPNVARQVTAVIGEAYIENNSNSRIVAERLAYVWENHRGPVSLYGDASGGSRSTSGVTGTDWDLITAILRPVFGERLHKKYPRVNPYVRQRINAVNSRILSCDGTVRLLVDRAKAPHVVRDLEGVSFLPGGAGEIDKSKDSKLTHISDALGYYIEKVWPLGRGEGGTGQMG